jgi:hypothetical protein
VDFPLIFGPVTEGNIRKANCDEEKTNFASNVSEQGVTHGAQINFGDQTPYFTYVTYV